MSQGLAISEASSADAELVSQACRGSGSAFAAIMRQNNRRLYRIARGILKDDAEAEEAVQESYLLAFRNLHSFRGTAKLSTWLARIVVNEALGRLRQQKPTASVDEIDRLATLDGQAPVSLLGASGRATPESAAAHAELRRLLETAVGNLPPPFRIVFVLCAIEQMSIEDVAASVGIPKNTVKTRLHRAKGMLRDSLGSTFAVLLEDSFPFAGVRCERIVVAVLCSLEELGLGALGGATEADIAALPPRTTTLLNTSDREDQS